MASREALLSLLAKLTKQKEELNRKIISTSTRLNQICPVNRLPDELLVDVFLLVQASTRSWPRVLVICKRWRAVAFTSARLWCRLDVGTKTPRARIGASLRYSGNLPLDVTFDRKVRVSTILYDLSPHLNRIRTLRFNEALHDEIFDVSAFLRNRLPSLRTLHVRFDPYPEDSDYESDEFEEREEEMAFCLTPVPDQFPALEELVLRAVGVRTDSAAFPLLKTVQLTDCFHDVGLPLQSFVSMLSGLRQLTTLTIRRYRTAKDSSLPQNLPPSLRCLELEDEEEWTRTYLDHLVLPPNLSKLSVTKHAVPDHPFEGLLSTHPLYSCLPHPLDETVRTILSEVQSARIDLRDSRNRVEVVGTAGTRVISLAAVARQRCIMEPDPVEDLLSLFMESPLKDLQIFGIDDHDDHGPTEDDWWDMLWYLPSLKRLAFTVQSGARSIRNHLLSLLASNVEKGDNPLVSSDLEELRINVFVEDSEELLETLVNVLEYRQDQEAQLSRLYIAISTRPGKVKTKENNTFPKARYQSTLEPLVGVVHCRTFGKWFSNWDYTPPPSTTDANVAQ